MFDQEYVEIVERVYDSAADPALWDAVLEKLAAPARGNGFIIIHDPVLKTGSCPIFANWETGWIDAYNKYYAGRNVWLARASQQSVGQATSCEIFLGRSDLLKTEWYNDFLRPQKLIKGMGVTLLQNPRRFVRAGVIGPDCTDDEHKAHVALLQRLA